MSPRQEHLPQNLSTITLLQALADDHPFRLSRLGLCSAAKRAKMWHIQHVASALEEVRIHDHGFQNASAFNDMR